MDINKKIVIAGAGPAGITMALELQKSGFKNITIYEMDSQVGGISKTFNYKGNRIDIGGHRFFSKSDWVMNWWVDILPIEKSEIQSVKLRYKGLSRDSLPKGGGIRENDKVMLVRDRLSRIYFNKKFFGYPLKLNLDSLKNLGLKKTVIYGISFAYAKIKPVKPEKSLEDFIINRFGNGLYRQFFKEYTEKVWGVECHEISADWGAQRIKSLSILSALTQALKSSLGFSHSDSKQTSLIEQFIYPKYGPGQMWETAVEKFKKNGGCVEMGAKVVSVDIKDGLVKTVCIKAGNGTIEGVDCDYFASTMPIKELVNISKNNWSDEVFDVANNLQYRDFITVGLLYDSSSLKEELKDNWIYIQEPGVNVGRVQVFNNWSPYMVSDKNKKWIGLEFFCRETDDLWKMSDQDLKELAQAEMRKIELVNSGQAIDAVVLRVPKAYPGYFGEAYKKFDILRESIDKVSNLFLIGRNGMHRYNNQDHSMLTAKEAARQIAENVNEKDKIWSINIDDEYHEEK